MIYICVDIHSFQKELSQNRMIILKYLEKQEDISLLSSYNINIKNIKKNDIILYFTIRIFSHPSVRFIKMMIEKTSNIDCKKYIYIEDFYNIEKMYEFCSYYHLYNIIFSMNHEYYKRKLLKKNPNFNIYTLHHYFHLDMFPKNIPEKEYDILIYGNINKKIYPLRYFLNNLFEKYKDKFRIKIIKMNSNYKLDTTSIIGRELYDEISKSYITIATTGKYNFFTKKYQEIPLSGSMIMGNIPIYYKNIYTKDTILEINKMNENEIIKKIDKVLEHKEELLEKTRKLQEKMREMFSIENVYKELKSIMS